MPGSASSRLVDPVRTLLVSMVLVEVTSGFTQQYLSPLLPGIGVRSGITSAQISWIYVVQTVSMAVLTPVLSRLGDSHGYRRILRLSVGMVTVGSLLMALWPTLPLLLLGAVLQGGVVGFMPLMIGILRNRAGDEASRRGIGILVGALLLATGFGGIVAGVFGASDARHGLWVGVAAGVLGLVACVVMPDADTRPSAERFSMTAFGLLTVGLAGVVLALSQGSAWGWTSAATLLSGAVGLAALALWPYAELRTDRPMVDVRVFRNRRIAVLSVVTFFLAFSTLGSIVVNATFLAADPASGGYGFGLDSDAIGWALLAFIAAGIAASSLTPFALRRIGDRATLLAGGVATAIGFAGLALAHDDLTVFLILTAFNGIGLGVFESATRALSVEAVPQEDTAIAAGINELVLSLGAAVGAAALSAALAAHSDVTGHVATGGYTTGWWMCCAGGVLAGISALLLRRQSLLPGTEVPAPVPQPTSSY
ncbi:MFS transporter [Streptomyces sp. NBC_01257]|uniref:MFS transporter n=1 Tax=Streptomyces sp. NBC_01257 TaxID=2903799 RepID=UPI002DDA6ACC|nr:MFS transporter [Streptomyces sp. NBC_01257]WRZ69109.1 MFS transporter [Streptomyces sp. NBC_01257]